MNIQIDSHGDIKILRVQEDRLAYPVLGSFFSKVSEVIEAGAKKMIIDLTEVDYIDSASIGCLMDIYRSANEASGTVKLMGLQERVETMVSMTGLHNLMEIFREESAALDSF